MVPTRNPGGVPLGRGLPRAGAPSGRRTSGWSARPAPPRDAALQLLLGHRLEVDALGIQPPHALLGLLDGAHQLGGELRTADGVGSAAGHRRRHEPPDLQPVAPVLQQHGVTQGTDVLGPDLRGGEGAVEQAPAWPRAESAAGASKLVNVVPGAGAGRGAGVALGPALGARPPPDPFAADAPGPT